MSALVLEDVDLAVDEPVPSADDVPMCEVCGTELVYSGRGRKPKRCDEHKRQRRTGDASSTSSVKSTALGKQAAQALGQLNGLIATAMLLAPEPYRLPQTASAIATANDAFVEQAAAALSTDPKLARLIIQSGAASGRAALIVSYAMLAGAVVPVGVLEYRENRRAGRSAGA